MADELQLLGLARDEGRLAREAVPLAAARVRPAAAGETGATEQGVYAQAQGQPQFHSNWGQGTGRELEPGVHFVELSRAPRGAPGAHSPWAMIRCAALELTPPWPTASSERGSDHCISRLRTRRYVERQASPKPPSVRGCGFAVPVLRYRMSLLTHESGPRSLSRQHPAAGVCGPELWAS